MATQPPVMHLSSDEGPGGFCDLGSDISALIVTDMWSEAQPGRYSGMQQHAARLV